MYLKPENIILFLYFDCRSGRENQPVKSMFESGKLDKTRFQFKIFPLNWSINLLYSPSDLNIFNWTITEIIKLVKLLVS